MFRRANRIVITESSASKKAHPRVGDVGYLNNMYLFFVDKFILLDAFFFYYKSDNGRNKKRRERKRFIIDLGMSEQFKRDLDDRNIPRRFFVSNKYVANLTSTDYRIYNADGALMRTMVEFPNRTLMWYRYDNNKGKALIGRAMPYIPYGQIDVVPYKRAMYDTDFNELRCWIECLLPILTSAVYNTNGDARDGRHAVSRGLQRVYAPTWVNYTTSRYVNGTLMVALPKADLENNAGFNRYKIVNEIQRSKSVTESVIRNCEDIVLSGWKNINRKYSMPFSNKRTLRGLIRICTDALSVQNKGLTMQLLLAKIVMTLVFRSIIMSDNIEKKLFDLKDAGVIGFNTSEIVKIASYTKGINKSEGHGSAALNRIFDK